MPASGLLAPTSISGLSALGLASHVQPADQLLRRAGRRSVVERPLFIKSKYSRAGCMDRESGGLPTFLRVVQVVHANTQLSREKEERAVNGGHSKKSYNGFLLGPPGPQGRSRLSAIPS